MNDCNIIQFPRGRDLYGLIRYPYFGIRFGPAAGARIPIAISKGPYCFTLKKGDTRLTHPEPFKTDGSVTEALRADLLWETVQFVRQGWRPTVHWSENASSTVWVNAVQHRLSGQEISLPFDLSTVARSDVAEWPGIFPLRPTEI